MKQTAAHFIAATLEKAGVKRIYGFVVASSATDSKALARPGEGAVHSIITGQSRVG